jgi:hypothetical protein
MRVSVPTRKDKVILLRGAGAGAGAGADAVGVGFVVDGVVEDEDADSTSG